MKRLPRIQENSKNNSKTYFEFGTKLIKFSVQVINFLVKSEFSIYASFFFIVLKIKIILIYTINSLSILYTNLYAVAIEVILQRTWVCAINRKHENSTQI